jgi:hypothetical protein
VGLISCGVICPLGAILSFAACFRRPRGLAVAGLIIGLVGSVWLLVLFFVIGIAGLTVVLVLLGVGKYGEVVADGLAISSATSAYVAAHGTLPKALGDLPSLTKDERTDPWGTPYAFSPGPGPNEFTLISAGPDRKLGTDDDPKVHETISRGTP